MILVKYLIFLPFITCSLTSCFNSQDIEKHYPKYVEGKEATCTEDGVITHYHCDICNKDFKYANETGELTTLIIPAKGHSMHKHDGKIPSCTEVGNLIYYTCDNEYGIYYKDEDGIEKYNGYNDTVIPLTDHLYSSLEITGNFKKEYKAFEKFDTSNLVVKALCKNCDKKIIINKDKFEVLYESKPNDSFRFGDTKVVISVPSLGIQKEINNLNVSKILIDKPTPNETIFIYDGTEKEVKIPENENYTIINNKQTEVGEYEAIVSLKDKVNYIWSTGTSDDFKISFSIGKPSDLIVGLESMYVTTCHQAPDLSKVSSKSGSLIIKYYEDEECSKEVNVSELVEGDYFIKATTTSTGFIADCKIAKLRVNHVITHYGFVKSTLFKNGHIEYWNCSACNSNFKDKDLKQKISNISDKQSSLFICESAICSNGVSYNPTSEIAPNGFDKVNKVNVSGKRTDTLYYSEILVNSYDSLTFAIRGDATLLLDGWDKYVDDFSWVIVEVSEISEYTYKVLYKDVSNNLIYENNFYYCENPDGYILGALNNVMFKACTYLDASGDIFYVTELRGIKKESSIAGEIIDESAISANGISKEKLQNGMPNGYENVYKIGVKSDDIYMHGQFYSDKVLTSYSEVHFALKTSGFWSFGNGNYAYKQNEWLYFSLTNNFNETFNLSVKTENDEHLYSKSNMPSSKEECGVYTNNALNMILFGNADIIPYRFESNDFEVFASEIRGTRQSTFEIVKNSKTDYKIIFEKNNRHISRTVDLLKQNLKNASGISDITSEMSNNEKFDENVKAISIGNTSLLKTSGALACEALEGGYLIKTYGQSIFVYTKTSGDYITAINKLMEMMFGYKYIASCETIINYNTNINFPESELIIHPSFSMRNRIVDMSMLDGDQSASLGFTSGYEWETTGFAHPMSERYLNYETYKDSHPSWYSIGEDKWGQTQRQLCYSAHGSLSEYQAMVDGVCNDIINDINGEFKWTFDNSNEPTFTIDLSMQDNWYECNCEYCRADKTKYGSYGAQQLHFVNDIANKMDTWFNSNRPDIKHYYKLLAYQQAEFPPTTISYKLNKNLLVQYAPVYVDISKPISSSGVNKQFYNELKTWVDLFENADNVSSENIGIWNYSYSTHNIVPAYDYHALYETYETFRNLGIKNISTEFVTNGSQLTYFQDLRLYLMAKFMNDTSLNVDQISKEFIDLYYGSASEKMFELLKTCNNNMKSTYTDENTVFETHNNQKYWPKDVVNKMISLCEEAIDIINGSNESSSRKSVLIDRVNREKATAVYMSIQYGYVYLSTKTEYKNFFSTICKKFNITHIDTSTTVEQWLD